MPSQRPRFLTAALLALALPASPAAAVTGQWVAGHNVEVRLIATGTADGRPQAGLEIVLAPGWKTYWRTPGDGGLPPSLDFSGSWNLASTTVGFPPPRQYRDGNFSSNIYEGRVVLPIAVEPAVAGAPVTLNLKLMLGVCETVCIPVDLAATLVISPRVADPEVESILQSAQAALPGPVVPGVREVLGVEPMAGSTDARPRFLARVRVPDPDDATLFVEGPAGWYPLAAGEDSRDGNVVTYRFAFDRLDGTAPIAGARLTFTIVSSGASQQTITLP